MSIPPIKDPAPAPAAITSILRRPVTNPDDEVHVAGNQTLDILSSHAVSEQMRHCNKPISLDAQADDAIEEFFALQRNHSCFKWNLNGFLEQLIPYFSSDLVQGTIELTKGAIHAIGKPFWEKTLGTKIDTNLITPAMWRNFCTGTPKLLEFWITLPDSFNTEEQLNRFKDLIVYFFAAQAATRSPKPTDFREALREFDLVMEFDPHDPDLQYHFGKENFQRLEEVKNYISAVEQDVLRFHDSVRITTQNNLLRVAFKFVKPTHSFRLKLGCQEKLSCEFQTAGSAWLVLHNKLLHKQNPEELLGGYCVGLTLEGCVYDAVDGVFDARSYAAGIRHLPPSSHCDTVSVG